MKHLRKAEIAASPVTPLTLACVLDRVNRAQHLSKPQRRDMQSALRMVARLSGRLLDTIEASVPVVRQVLTASCLPATD